MITIAVDAMGSDNSPNSEVEGAVQAARAYGVRVLLVGREAMLAPMLKERGAASLPIEIRNASQTIAMDEQPVAAFRKKRDSSIRVGAELVRDGSTGLLYEAGNAVALAKVVEWAVAHPVEMKLMQARARREFVERYTASLNYGMLMEIYRSLPVARVAVGAADV